MSGANHAPRHKCSWVCTNMLKFLASPPLAELHVGSRMASSIITNPKHLPLAICPGFLLALFSFRREQARDAAHVTSLFSWSIYHWLQSISFSVEVYLQKRSSTKHPPASDEVCGRHELAQAALDSLHPYYRILLTSSLMVLRPHFHFKRSLSRAKHQWLESVLDEYRIVIYASHLGP
jgi:hypothetical protein